MKVAVLGVGLIGGSIGLAAREREGAEVVGFGRSPEKLDRAVELGAIDAAAASLEEALDGAEACFCCAPVGALPAQIEAALGVAGPELRGHRRRVGQAQHRRRDRRRALRGRPPDRGRRDGRRGARARRPVRGRRLVPDPERALLGPALRAPSPAREVPRRAPGGDRRRRRTTACWPRSATCRTCSPTCWWPAPRAATTPPRMGPSFRDATRVAGANSAIWTDIYMANREAIADGDRRRRRPAARGRGDAAQRGRRRGHRVERRRGGRPPARCSRPTSPAGAVHELRLTVPNRPGIVAQVALALGKAGVNIVDLALAPALGHALRRHDALDRGRRPGGPRRGADRRARLPRSRRVSSRRFAPSGPLQGELPAARPTSRSPTARRCSARCATSRWTVRNYLDSADTQSTLDALLTLGAGVEEAEHARELLIRGVGLHAALEATGGQLDVGNSGTLLRLLPGWLAGQPGGEWTLDGDESIRRRPVDRVVEPLALMGAGMEARDGRFTPLTVRGAELQGIEYALPVASAQVKSCVLIAGMLATGSTTVTESRAEPRPHRAHPAPLARAVRARRPDGSPSPRSTSWSWTRSWCPATRPRRRSWSPPPAWCPDSRVVISDVGLNWTRTGLLPDRPAHGRGDRRRPRGAGHRRPTTSRWASSTWPTARSRAPRSAPRRCRWRSTSSRWWRCSAPSPTARRS